MAVSTTYIYILHWASQYIDFFAGSFCRDVSQATSILELVQFGEKNHPDGWSCCSGDCPYDMLVVDWLVAGLQKCSLKST